MAYDVFETLGDEPGLQARVMNALDDPRLQEILARIGSSPEVLRAVLGGEPGRIAAAWADRRAMADAVLVERPGAAPVSSERAVAEAIVNLTRRPVYLIRGGRVDAASALAPFEKNIEAEMAQLAPLIGSVGRVEFVNSDMAWGGTGWLVEEDLVVTNRHVAEIVGEPDGRGRYRFRAVARGITTGARLDLLEEFGSALDETIEVARIEYIAPADGPDVALLRLAKRAGEPVALAADAPRQKTLVGAIGYPANDSRNDPSAIAHYFGGIFDKKRFAPGYVTQEVGIGGAHFMHDCSTLGGNSGSVVVDLDRRQAVGLHFAGAYKKANYAVPATAVTRVIKGLRVVATGFSPADVEAPDGEHRAQWFEGRRGYDRNHLGVPLPLPGFAAHSAAVADVTEADGAVSKEARYTHFSVVYHRARRMPLFTAVNIDGESARHIKRGNDRWFADLRLDRAIQLDAGHYSHPEIDRGHMVRREDGNWGDAAQRANDDTFHYINAAPQHAQLNQGKTAWLGLENYVLENARTRGFRVTVFTGPVLRDSDRVLETRSGDLQIPEEFWKVVVTMDDATGRLRATAYVLGQGALLDDIAEVAFAYGAYGAFQVSVASVERATGLDFHGLAATDPLAAQEAAGLFVRRQLHRAEEAIL